jgi:hypothetical protein
MSQDNNNERKPDVDCTDNEEDTAHISPPTEPGEYRISGHFRDRLRQRVPESYQPTLPERLIREGTVKKLATDVVDKNDNYGKPVAFTTVGPEKKPWTLIAGLRHEAFVNSDKLHTAITIFQGAPRKDAPIIDQDRGDGA